MMKLDDACDEWRLRKGVKRRPKDRRPKIEPEPLIIEPAEKAQNADMEFPRDWQKGALLNVRNYGHEYIVTLYPEEYDPRSPERSLHFTNPARCQDFVSAWYAREPGGRPW